MNDRPRRHGPSPPVTLHVWRVPLARVPQALLRVARDRRTLRCTPGVRFVKLLGTGRFRGVLSTGADPTRWAALIVWDAAADFDRTRVAASWRRLASAYCRLDLSVLATRGTWAGQEPFGPTLGRSVEGPVLALTRARLRPTRATAFWHSAAPVATAVDTASGLLASFGIGEAPIGWQGTVSVWRTAGDLVEFAYRHPVHRRVMERTPAEGWYAEELFARFAVIGIAGDRSVIGWAEERIAHEDVGMRTVR